VLASRGLWFLVTSVVWSALSNLGQTLSRSTSRRAARLAATTMALSGQPTRDAVHD
jgi:hypothetical protein